MFIKESHEKMGHRRFGIMRYLYGDNAAAFFTPSSSEDGPSKHRVNTIIVEVFHCNQPPFMNQELSRIVGNLLHRFDRIDDAWVLNTNTHGLEKIGFKGGTWNSMNEFEAHVILYLKYWMRRLEATPGKTLHPLAHDRKTSFMITMADMKMVNKHTYLMFNKIQFAKAMCISLVKNPLPLALSPADRPALTVFAKRMQDGAFLDAAELFEMRRLLIPYVREYAISLREKGGT